jgi:hypothetical protein
MLPEWLQKLAAAGRLASVITTEVDSPTCVKRRREVFTGVGGGASAMRGAASRVTVCLGSWLCFISRRSPCALRVLERLQAPSMHLRRAGCKFCATGGTLL